MRFLILTAAAMLPAASSAAPSQSKFTFGPTPPFAGRTGADCPRPDRQHAIEPGQPLKPRKLGELPPGTAYMAVYRTDEKGCLDPLTAVEYRSDRKR